MIPPVMKELTVPITPDRAFDIFWREIGDWWPRDRHSLSAMAGKVAQAVEFEPGLGGTITEVMHDGTRELWGRITEWQPGMALSFAWQIRRPATEATLVRITFSASEAGTKVALTHSGWEALGDDGAQSRDSYDSGWNTVFLDRYRNACRQYAAT